METIGDGCLLVTLKTEATDTSKSMSVAQDIVSLTMEGGQNLGNNQLYEVPENFQSSCLQLLKCNSCRDLIYPPIYNCKGKDGHTFCRSCSKGKNCRICKSSFSKTRNHYLESIASLLRVKCSNALCKEMASGEKIEQHKIVCQYRPISCLETELKKCKGQPIKFENYEAHLREVHQCQSDVLDPAGFIQLDFQFKNLLADANKVPLRVLTMESKTFIFQLRKFSGTQLCFAVFFLGSESEAKKYRCVLQLEKPPDGTEGWIQWETSIHGVHTSLDSLASTGDLFVISEKTILPFCETQDQWVKLSVGVRVGLRTEYHHK